jgi:prolyl-tRNA editing enzyme YbaK/EbsC (Cys-tRNA(Pro) deacylase)
MSTPEAAAAVDGAERVRRVLERHGLAAGVRTFDRSTKTAQAAAEAVGCHLGQIAKSIVFVADGCPVLAVVAGDRKGDVASIAAELGAASGRLADTETVAEATGYTVGSVSPFVLPAGLIVLVDESLGRFETVLPAAGTADSVVSVPLDSLVVLSGGRMAPISR